MDTSHKRTCRLALRSLLPTYRVLKLEKRVPFLIWSNPNGNHYQFSCVDLNDACSALENGRMINIFLVDSLQCRMHNEFVVKFYVYAAIFFFKLGITKIEGILKERNKKSLEFIYEIIPRTFIHDINALNISIESVSMVQENDFDCGIFTIVQMYRLTKYLYGNENCNVGSFKKNNVLSREDIVDCLTSHRSIDQKYVDEWRIREFLYLLSLWVKKFQDMGGLTSLNLKVNEPFYMSEDVPYLSVESNGAKYMILSVDHSEKCIKFETCYGVVSAKWGQFKFHSTPTCEQMENFNISLLDVKLTNRIRYSPSTLSLASFFPGHANSSDKYLRSDYMMWKCSVLTTCGKRNDKIHLTRLGLDGFDVANADTFFKGTSMCNPKYYINLC